MSEKNGSDEPTRSNLPPPSTASAQPDRTSDPAASTVFTAAGAAAATTDLPKPDGLVGKTLGERYYIERKLGQGGIGAVYLARDTRLVNKAVVVKVLLEKSEQSERARIKFMHEREALARLNHPGVIGVIDHGTLADGKPYLVMQYVEGRDLRSLVRPEGADLDQCADLIEQIGRALGAAHEQGILHRDLKPENIMVQPVIGGHQHIKIIDFGVAKVRDSRIAPSTAVSVPTGTAVYMSPEQLAAEKLTPASDVYALGLITYELVAGRRPFNPETIFQLETMQREGVQVPPKALRPALPAAAQTVILKALEFEPARRYQSALEFGEDFARAMGRTVDGPGPILDSDHGSRPPSELTRTLVPKPGRTAWLMAAAAFAVVAFVGLGVWWGLSKTKTQVSVQRNDPPPAGPTTSRSLSYGLMVQKTRDGKPYEKPYATNGDESSENGYKFQFNVESPQDGYLYLINEGLDDQKAMTLNLLFPTADNDHSAHLAANQRRQTGWLVFDRNPGTEHFWIVWSAQPVAELEAVKQVFNETDQGVIKDSAKAAAVRAFLYLDRPAKPAVTPNANGETNSITVNGDLLVSKIDLKHH